MQGIHIKADGSKQIVVPKEGKFTLEELQGYVGGTIDRQTLPDGRAVYLNDNGKLQGLPKNEEATEIWKQSYPIEQYPFNNDELIVGDVLILSKEDDEKLNEEDV